MVGFLSVHGFSWQLESWWRISPEAPQAIVDGRTGTSNALH
jgi:hypothetical protein